MEHLCRQQRPCTHVHVPSLLARTRTALVATLLATILDRADPARCTLSRHEQEARAKLLTAKLEQHKEVAA